MKEKSHYKKRNNKQKIDTQAQWTDIKLKMNS